MIKYFVPFFGSSCAYFYYLNNLTPSIGAMLLKCCPIYCLASAVYAYGKTKASKLEFSGLIFRGLLCSSIGDACLVWKDLFPLGMVAFAAAHYFYIKAFSFKQLKPIIGVFMYALLVVVLLIVMPNLKDKVVFYGVPFYGAILATMSWRAMARVGDGTDAYSFPKIACAVGSLLFVISDFIICFHDLQEPIPHGQLLIMITYYAAQFGISLSILSDADPTTEMKKK